MEAWVVAQLVLEMSKAMEFTFQVCACKHEFRNLAPAHHCLNDTKQLR